ncbi:MAG: hypothetical protein QF662_08970, partial [Phycisphaerae bacterium]|nr:hypothetical protein [Phycisphaerae bacterium]
LEERGIVFEKNKRLKTDKRTVKPDFVLKGNGDEYIIEYWSKDEVKRHEYKMEAYRQYEQEGRGRMFGIVPGNREKTLDRLDDILDDIFD